MSKIAMASEVRSSSVLAQAWVPCNSVPITLTLVQRRLLVPHNVRACKGVCHHLEYTHPREAAP